MQGSPPLVSSPDGSTWDQSEWAGEDTYDELFSNTDTDTVSSIGMEDPHTWLAEYYQQGWTDEQVE